MNARYWKAFLGMVTAAFVTLVGMHGVLSPKPDKIVSWTQPYCGVCRMPIVEDSDPITASLKTAPPEEQRGPEVRKWLSPSLKISVRGASGSGTIIYFDQNSGYAYVASCGHLWSGTKSAEELKRSPVSCDVITWYQNEKKLDTPKTYTAEVLFWSNNRGYDSSLIRFKPDWVPVYFPIAPVNHNIPVGIHVHSVGCDRGREVAHYDVEVVGIRSDDLVTKFNSPRPGRSGGGLMDDAGFYIGTCWGTSNIDGSGIGYFTPLSSIRKVWTQNGFDWLLRVPQSGSVARDIPILDMQQPGRQFPADFIPIPVNPMPLRY